MMNIIPCPHRREPLRRQEQPSLFQLEPMWSLRRTCWGCSALVFSGPCNTSHLQLITSVFVSNRMETRLKINVNHTMYRVRCGTAQGMRWRWFGGPSAQQCKMLPGPGWVFTSCWTFFSASCAISFVSSFFSCYTCGDCARGEVTKQLEAPMSQRCTPSSAWILSLMPFLFKSHVLGSSSFAAGLRGAPLGLSVLCQEWLGGGNGPSVLRACTP